MEALIFIFVSNLITKKLELQYNQLNPDYR